MLTRIKSPPLSLSATGAYFLAFETHIEVNLGFVTIVIEKPIAKSGFVRSEFTYRPTAARTDFLNDFEVDLSIGEMVVKFGDVVFENEVELDRMSHGVSFLKLVYTTYTSQNGL